jgi:transcriptional regulator with XRE-family HTH domain
MTDSVISPDDVFRRRLRQVREARHLSRPQLAELLAAVGHRIAPSELRKLENGPKNVLLRDVLALAYVLDVSPLSLLLPYGTGETVTTAGITIPVIEERVTVVPGTDSSDFYSFKSWLRGREPLSGQDATSFYRESPPDELIALRRAALDLEIGEPTVTGANALRTWLFEEGELPIDLEPGGQLWKPTRGEKE